MNPSRWEKVKEIVAGAMELERGDRPAFVERVCEGDAALRHNVETLLNADDPNSLIREIDHPPAHIGPYRIVREIGRGGMGIVYLGERLGERKDDRSEQRAAIKAIQGVDSAAVLRRFFQERGLLDRLQHPNIARLFDGGMFEDRPYFAMEYIEGEPILEYANQRQLSIADRIRLFLPVCAAVEHAHCNLILHRDLKPASVLVDTSGAPKLLDFGIATLLEETGQEAYRTNRGEPLTTAADVYGLGLLLFELLAGEPPYSGPSNEQPLPWPSELADGPAARLLKGDLDDIILKAMAAEPAERYQRAGDLAADLRRYLQGLAVQAGAGGRLYRMRKFAARNRWWMVAAAAVTLAIGFAAGDAMVQGRQDERRVNELRQLTGKFLFEFHDAIANLPGSAPARELVVKRTLQYLDILSRDAGNNTGLKRELAESYLRVGDAQGLDRESNLGKPVEARASYQKAVDLLAEIARSAPSDVRAQSDLARAQNQLASAMASTGDAKKAWNMLQDVADSLESLSRKQGLDAAAKFNLGRTYFGISEFERNGEHYKRSLQTRERSIDIFRDLARDPKNHEALRWYSTSEKRLASLYLLQFHDSRKAAESLNIAIGIDRQRVAQNPGDAVAKLDLTLGQSYMAALLQRKGDLPEAQRLFESTVSARKELLAADPYNYRLRYLLLTDYVHLGDLLRLARNTAGARAVYREGLAVAAPLQIGGQADAEAARTIAELRTKSME